MHEQTGDIQAHESGQVAIPSAEGPGLYHRKTILNYWWKVMDMGSFLKIVTW